MNGINTYVENVECVGYFSGDKEFAETLKIADDSFVEDLEFIPYPQGKVSTIPKTVKASPRLVGHRQSESFVQDLEHIPISRGVDSNIASEGTIIPQSSGAQSATTQSSDPQSGSLKFLDAQLSTSQSSGMVSASSKALIVSPQSKTTEQKLSPMNSVGSDLLTGNEMNSFGDHCSDASRKDKTLKGKNCDIISSVDHCSDVLGKENTTHESDVENVYPDHINRKMLPLREHHYKKSLSVPPDQSFWDFHPSLRMSPVSLKEFLGVDSNLGRLYYKFFQIRDVTYTVGEFARFNDDIFRIIGVFQASKSWEGAWDNDTKEIQKRGHPYAILMQFKLPSNKDRRKCVLSNELLPVASKGNQDSLGLFCLPEWLGCSDLIIEKLSVDVLEKNNAQGNKVQRLEYRKNKTPKKDFVFMGKNAISVRDLPKEWACKLRAKRVHYVRHRRQYSQHLQPQQVALCVKLNQSSDDSDGFESGNEELDDDEEEGSLSPNGEEKDSISDEISSLSNDYSHALPRIVLEGQPPHNEAATAEKECKKDRERETKEAAECARNIRDNAVSPDVRALSEKYENSLLSLNRRARPFSDFCQIMDVLTERLDRKTMQPHFQKKYDDINKARCRLGLRSFRGLQEHVCFELWKNRREDIIYVAPPGHGKSACFVVPALLAQPKITIVIEPLKATIESQIVSLRKCKTLGITVEQLYSYEDAASFEGIPAHSRFTEIVNKFHKNDFTEKIPSLIFLTPELFMNWSVLKQIQNLAKLDKLERIVWDEFDEMAAASEDYRNALKEIPSVRNELPDIPMSLFSATSAQEDLVDILAELHKKRHQTRQMELPKLFQEDNAIPASLAFSVERKISSAQVAKRIAFLLKNYDLSSNKIPKAICFCGTPRRCKDVQQYLSQNGVVSELYTGRTSNVDRRRIQENLRKGTVRVVCATKAFGRGVDIPDIRFVFHTVMPLNLRDYIQETGRAGRDGKVARCVLFYRPHDLLQNKMILGISSSDHVHSHKRLLEDDEKKKKMAGLDNVIHYCTNGNLHCRYKDLSSFVPNKDHNQQCGPASRCDNCHLREQIEKELSEKGMKESAIRDYEVDYTINPVIIKALEEVKRRWIEGIDEGGFRKLMWEQTTDDPVLHRILKAGGAKHSLTEDVLRLLVNCHILTKQKPHIYINTENFCMFMHQLRTRDVRINIRNARRKVTADEWREEMSMKLNHVMEAVDDSLVIESDSLVIKRAHLGYNDNDQPLRKMARLSPCQPKVTVSTRLPSLLRMPPIDPHDDFWWKELSFLPRFEFVRLYNSNDITDLHIHNQLHKKIRDDDFPWNNTLEVCTFFNRLSEKASTMTTYRSVLEQLESSGNRGDAGTGASLCYSAEFNNGKLRLLPPEKAHNCRIFRKFGSHRFLHLKIRSVELHSTVLQTALMVCGRVYRFLWAKISENPQLFVFFAEHGPGILPEEKMTAEEVQRWCVPSAMNPGLTVGKFFKRVKLSFSNTDPGGILPSGCLEITKDIISRNESENKMTDGCGLVSNDALQYIYKAYNKSHNNPSWKITDRNDDEMDTLGSDDETDDCSSSDCPFTSFQGRIGGFKGMWVLDRRLGEGIKVVCRESQLKYKVPMRSLIDGSNEHEIGLTFDTFYDTVDICSWDRFPHESKLSLRHIQILEYRGVSLTYLQKCVDMGIKPITKMIKEFDNGSKETLINMRKKNAILNDDEYSDDLLLNMALADIPACEPAFKDAFSAWAKLETKSMRDKAKYPVKCCRYLRLIPDHTQLLEEGEVFVAGNDDHKSIEDVAGLNTHILTMRSPAYFAGDLLKLRLVRRTTLRQRDMQRQLIRKTKMQTRETVGDSICGKYDGIFLEDGYSFFENLHTGLIISTKGSRSAADMMSGGDFDGDEAWVCWNKELVDQVKDCSPVDTSGKEFEVKKSMEEQAFFKETSVGKLIDYARHFAGHHPNLCKLSVMLDTANDRYGFEHEVTNAIATQAFLQVDHPYFLCNLGESIRKRYEEDEKNYGTPHWKNKNPKVTGGLKYYRSEKMLGQLYNYVDSKITDIEKNDIFQGQLNYYNPHVRNMIEMAETKEPKDLEKHRKICREAFLDYNKKANAFLKKLEKEGNNTKDVKYAWFKDMFSNYRETLFGKLNTHEQQLRASVLYEQTYKESRYKQGPSKFAWQVAGSNLQRIHCDGSSGRVSTTISTMAERVLYGSRKNKM